MPTKTLLLIRHAKSSWDNMGLSDFERPLNDRGNGDAPKMAKRLADKINKINLLLVSTAQRTRETAAYFLEEVEVEKVLYLDELYHSSANTLRSLIMMHAQEEKTVAVIAHNPGITYFANQLCRNVSLDNMPTCAIFSGERKAKNWQVFFEEPADFKFFIYPKDGKG